MSNIGARVGARRASPVVIGLAVVLFIVGGLGSNCGQPTLAEQCHGCKPGQIVVCADVCVTPIPRLGACDPSASHCTSVCADGMSCVPLGSTPNGGVCLDVGLHNGSECPFGSAPDLCAVGASDHHPTFCRAPSCGNNTSVCAPFGEEHDNCDSNFDSPKCAPCDKNLECDPTGQCRATCNTSADCDSQNRCQPGRGCLRDIEIRLSRGADLLTRGTGLCYTCAQTRAACSANVPCCGQEQLCPIVEAELRNTTPICCARTAHAGAVGGECTTRDECCGAEFPNDHVQCISVSRGTPRTCQSCTQTQGSCENGNQCCTGHCTNGACACVATGERCAVSAECCTENCDRGVCRERTTNDGGAAGGDGGGKPLTCRGPDDICDIKNPCCAGLKCNASGHCVCGSKGTSCDVPGGSNDHGQEDALCCNAGPTVGCGFEAGKGRVCTSCAHNGASCAINGCCADQGDCAFQTSSADAKCTVLPQCVDAGRQCTYGLVPNGFVRLDCCTGSCDPVTDICSSK